MLTKITVHGTLMTRQQLAEFIPHVIAIFNKKLEAEDCQLIHVSYGDVYTNRSLCQDILISWSGNSANIRKHYDASRETRTICKLTCSEEWTLNPLTKITFEEA